MQAIHSEKQGSVTYVIDQRNKVVKIFIISLGANRG